VVKFSGNEVEISTNDKPLTIKLTDSLHLYAPLPSSLANVKGSAYIGVVSKNKATSRISYQGLDIAEEIAWFERGKLYAPCR